MAETRCNSRSMDDVQVFCVLARHHTGDHRGVLWVENPHNDWEPSKATDYYWPHKLPKHRADVPARDDGITANDVWPKHRLELEAASR